MKSMMRIRQVSAKAVGFRLIKEVSLLLRFATLSVMALAAIFFAVSLNSTRQVEGATTTVGGCEVSPEFTIPRELAGNEPLNVKDGEYLLGRWQSPDRLLELKTVVSGGKRAGEIVSSGGRRLRQTQETLSKEAQECLKSRGLAMDRQGVFQQLIDIIAPTAYAAGCSSATSFKLVHLQGVHYVLLGRVGGGWVYCGTYYF